MSGFLFQAGLGVDMLVMVFAGALIGYYFAEWNGWSPASRFSLSLRPVVNAPSHPIPHCQPTALRTNQFGKWQVGSQMDP